jgi:hypothetical protein
LPEIRQKAQTKEAVELVQEYYKVYHKIPPKKELAEFFWLFEPRKELSEPSFIGKMRCVNNYAASVDQFLKTEPKFEGYESFIRYCLNADK